MATARDGFYNALSGNSIVIGGTIDPPVVAHVFLESGQSNNQGVAPYSESPIPVDTYIGSIQTWRRSFGGDMYSGDGAWYPLEYKTNNYMGRGDFGSVLQFGINLRDNLEDENNHIFIIKADTSGKAIDGWLDGGAENVAMYDGHITPALADLVANPSFDEVRVHGFFWDQGESDALNSTDANAYQAKLEAVISDLRTALGIPALPIIIRRTESTEYPYVTVVGDAQSAVAAADSSIQIIANGAWTYIADNKHLDGVSQNTVGDVRYAMITSMTDGELYSG